MRTARHRTTCPDCDEPIEPGDPIGRIGLYYVCAECIRAFEAENASVPSPAITGYPLSSQYEPPC